MDQYHEKHRQRNLLQAKAPLYRVNSYILQLKESSDLFLSKLALLKIWRDEWQYFWRKLLREQPAFTVCISKLIAAALFSRSIFN